MDAHAPGGTIPADDHQRQEVVTPAVRLGRRTYYPPDLVLKTWLPGERIVIGRYCSIGERVVICTGGSPLRSRGALSLRRDPLVSDDQDDDHWQRRVDRLWRDDSQRRINRRWRDGGRRLGRIQRHPAYAVAAGNPATVMRYRFSRTVVDRLTRVAWWNWPDHVVQANAAWFERPIAEFLDRFDPIGGTADGRDPQNPPR